MVGVGGVAGWALMTTLADELEVHPRVSVTVKVKVPVGIPLMVVLAAVPVVVTPPGFLLTVQVPLVGRVHRTTLPVARVQVGWVMVPTIGAVGLVLTSPLAVTAELQQLPLNALTHT